MILIADSGSTKTDWRLVRNKEQISSIKTIGLNPLHITNEQFNGTVIEAFKDTDISDISHVYFYGAGCGNTEICARVSKVLSVIFTHAAIEIESDLLGAARGLGGFESCAIGIVGTGSHAGLYNGSSLTIMAPSLGYVLGDEGSGVWIGKQLLRDYFYNIMPLHLRLYFKETYHLDRADCLNHIYNQKPAASYIAGFANFVAEHKSDPYIVQTIKSGFKIYIEHILLPLGIKSDLTVHFTGSIACAFKTELQNELNNYHLLSGHFIQKPIEGLIYFHTQHYS